MGGRTYGWLRIQCSTHAAVAAMQLPFLCGSVPYITSCVHKRPIVWQFQLLRISFSHMYRLLLLHRFSSSTLFSRQIVCLFVTRFPIPFFFYFSCISLGLTRAYRPHYIRFSFFAEKDVIYLFMRCEYHSFRVIINTSNEFHNTCHKKKCSHYIYIEQFCACYYFFFFRDVALSMVPVV